MSTLLIRFSYKIIRFIYRRVAQYLSTIFTKYILIANAASYETGFRSNGIPIVDINRNCHLIIGKFLKINNGLSFNRIGRQQPCFFIADHGGKILIGDNVGLSSTAIICHKHIQIGNNVRIGGNTVIYDTDFHNLDFHKRIAVNEDITTVGTKAVYIEDNVFIGAHSTILKGVTIGRNSIVGAGSVLTKCIPANQIWAGNPARFIKHITIVSNQTDTIQEEEFSTLL